EVEGSDAVTLYPAVPPPVARVADVERMQMLLESPSRSALQRLLAEWNPALHELRSSHRGVLRWAVDVDPLGI
ncbi:MAG: primosomal protein N', partial [Rubrivivax sp.]